MTGDQVIELILQLGVAGIGFAFFWMERKAHLDSIKAHMLEMKELRNRYTDDLREIAGIRHNLQRVQTYVTESKMPSESEMQSL